MRLNLYWRGRDVLDVEVHVWRKRPDLDDDIVVYAGGLTVTDLADDAVIDTRVGIPFGFHA